MQDLKALDKLYDKIAEQVSDVLDMLPNNSVGDNAKNQIPDEAIGLTSIIALFGICSLRIEHKFKSLAHRIGKKMAED